MLMELGKLIGTVLVRKGAEKVADHAAQDCECYSDEDECVVGELVEMAEEIFR